MVVQKKASFRIKSTDIGKMFSVFNGKSAITFLILESMVGFRFGQFVLTKKLGSSIHVKKSRKSKKK
jgi:ribosomal protein S19